MWRFIGIPFLKENICWISTIKKIHHLLANKNGPTYLLTSDRNMPELYKAVRLLGLVQNGKCEK